MHMGIGCMRKQQTAGWTDKESTMAAWCVHWPCSLLGASIVSDRVFTAVSRGQARLYARIRAMKQLQRSLDPVSRAHDSIKHLAASHAHHLHPCEQLCRMQGACRTDPSAQRPARANTFAALPAPTGLTPC